MTAVSPSETGKMTYHLNLVVGETYAIQPDDNRMHHAGTYIGTVTVVGSQVWLAFETGSSEDRRVRFYNPLHIRSLLPESDPTRLA